MISDNGSEFINDHIRKFCVENNITFTRTRLYRKNDNCFVEQKNYSVARKTVGWLRYEEDALKTLNELYKQISYHVNYFQPSMKMISKTRIGSKVIKKYDNPQTPYERLFKYDKISKNVKDKLGDKYSKLNIVKISEKIEKLQRRLFLLAKKQ